MLTTRDQHTISYLYMKDEEKLLGKLKVPIVNSSELLLGTGVSGSVTPTVVTATTSVVTVMKTMPSVMGRTSRSVRDETVLVSMG